MDRCNSNLYCCILLHRYEKRGILKRNDNEPAGLKLEGCRMGDRKRSLYLISVLEDSEIMLACKQEHCDLYGYFSYEIYQLTLLKNKIETNST